MSDDMQEKTPTPIEEAAEATAPTQELPKPKCPYCNADPLFLLARTFNVGRFKFLVPYCRACHKAVPAILVDVAEPRIQPASGIVRPQ